MAMRMEDLEDEIWEWPDPEFQLKLTKALKDITVLNDREIAGRMQQFTGDSNWTAQMIINRRTESKKKPNSPATRMDMNQINEYVWSHGVAPYHVARVMERKELGDSITQRSVIRYSSDQDFRMTPIQRFREGNPQVLYLKEYPSAVLQEVFYMVFLARADTGPFHQRENYSETVECVAGSIEMQFREPNDEVQQIVLKKNDKLQFDAAVPHRAVKIGPDAVAEVITISTIKRQRKGV